MPGQPLPAFPFRSGVDEAVTGIVHNEKRLALIRFRRAIAVEHFVEGGPELDFNQSMQAGSALEQVTLYADGFCRGQPAKGKALDIGFRDVRCHQQ